MLDLIKKRRSIRQYTDQDVTEDQVQAASRSGHGRPVRLERSIRGISSSCAMPDTRARLAATHTFSDMCARSPVVIVVCGDEKLSDHWISDGAAATENLLLAATALGLGSVWVGIYPRTEREAHVREVLAVPPHIRILCLVPVGYPAEEKPARTRFNPAKVHYEKF